MRNVIIFIRIYFTFFFFLILMGFSLYLLFSYNKYQNAVYSQAATEVTGKISTQVDKVSYYFSLRRTNDSLMKANEMLYNKLRVDFSITDTTNRLAIDTLRMDSLVQFRRFLFKEAKVVRNSVSQQNNYIVLHRGSDQGITTDMGVIAPNSGVVGTVIEVSKNFAVVMSLLHSQSSVSGRLKKGGETGNVVWDGKDRNILLLKDISKSAKINRGDSVVTSGFSEKFPSGLLIGFVKDIINDKSSSTYTVRLRSAVDFEDLQFAYVIQNLQKPEVDGLLKKVKNK